MKTFKEYVVENNELIVTEASKKDDTELAVGDSIFSKNDSEFYAKVTKISGSKVTVIYDPDGDYDDQIATVNRRQITGSKGDWEAANWTFR
jgi:hypothetical protein